MTKSNFETIALIIFSLAFGVLLTRTTTTLASLGFGATDILGDSSIAIDGSSTIAVGTSTAIGLTIGHSNNTLFQGNVTIDGVLSDAAGNRYSTTTEETVHGLPQVRTSSTAWAMSA